MKYMISDNHSKRDESAIIDMIIIHYTEIPLKDALERLTKSQYEVSCHYLIEQSGEIWQLVEEQEKAWHAGVSYFRGRDNINNFSIGIELDNDGKNAFANQQINALMDICTKLKHKYNIKNSNIIGHSDIAPMRKRDPGRKFPWQKLAENNIGLWYDNQSLSDNIIIDLGDIGTQVLEVQKKLYLYGYEIDLNNIYNEKMYKIIDCFKQHYFQDDKTSIWCKKHDAALDSLIDKVKREENV
jgi:N-acetylmuramoyl-L-alanine amidase